MKRWFWDDLRGSSTFPQTTERLCLNFVQSNMTYSSSHLYTTCNFYYVFVSTFSQVAFHWRDRDCKWMKLDFNNLQIITIILISPYLTCHTNQILVNHLWVLHRHSSITVPQTTLLSHAIIYEHFFSRSTKGMIIYLSGYVLIKSWRFIWKLLVWN